MMENHVFDNRFLSVRDKEQENTKTDGGDGCANSMNTLKTTVHLKKNE